MNTAHKALLWTPGDNQEVHCRLCRHNCHIAAGKRGRCQVRENRAGTLYTLVYGRLVARNVDPIEKKPLFHVAPGSLSYSIATAGCNFRCRHCQNYSISQVEPQQPLPPGQPTGADEVVAAALHHRCHSIAYTYTEPTVFFEFALDCMQRAQQQGLRNVFVTNGYQSAECLQAAATYLDAANIDLKSFSDDFYRRICGARLQPVLDNIAALHRLGVWVEVTTLVIPGHNDSADELRQIARFLADISADLPWHVTGFYPTYQLTDVPATPPQTLQTARAIGLEEGLRYVYTGNRPGSGGEDTCCPQCTRVVLARSGFSINRRSLTPGGQCTHCGATVAGRDMGGPT